MVVSAPAQIRCNFIHIILMECNGDMSQRDIPAMENLMNLCLQGDEQTLRNLAHPSNRTRAASAARFILHKHDFEVNKAKSIEKMAA